MCFLVKASKHIPTTPRRPKESPENMHTTFSSIKQPLEGAYVGDREGYRGNFEDVPELLSGSGH